jgi:hypothetical protein
MHITDELFADVLKHYKRPDLPHEGEIRKADALLYLAPEIIQLRMLGDTLDDICETLNANGLQISKPHLLKTLRPSSLFVVPFDGEL